MKDEMTAKLNALPGIDLIDDILIKENKTKALLPLLHKFSQINDNGTGTYYTKRVGIRALERFIQLADKAHTAGLTKSEFALMKHDASDVLMDVPYELQHIDSGYSPTLHFPAHCFRISAVLGRLDSKHASYPVLCELLWLERELVFAKNAINAK